MSYSDFTGESSQNIDIHVNKFQRFLTIFHYKTQEMDSVNLIAFVLEENERYIG